VNGFTVSSSDPPVFAGFYWSEGQQVWLRDSIAVRFVDLPASELIDEIAQSLKAAVARFYAAEGSPQDKRRCGVRSSALTWFDRYGHRLP
jgi:hypothetical protein